ncbi:uncharacterized protein H6S33_012569 [Morchella sextelata]|uniref:uncharacterized protein n=1 Tax=Morchella sextelata TaxID=1174677 RepID=UPI001D056408|nr:uncharacterized protein H6S33_012569 [Morchella sextelata]KAH0610023.1 hypothetical protein H6S33_012569 [Morchella sextelata]
MSAKTLLHKQYRTLAELWPTDPLRPNLSLQTLLQQRIARQFVQAVEGDEAIPTQNHSGPATTGSGSAGEGRPVVKFDEGRAAREINALGSLLEDRYRKKYPVSDRILKPRGNPEYYDNLIKELEQAPGRSWWETKLNAWKGYVRMK